MIRSSKRFGLNFNTAISVNVTKVSAEIGIHFFILNFDELKDFQGLEAFPYAENFSVAISAPFGWVIDIKEKVNGIATLFQRGLTLADAQKRKEWMYLEFWKIDKQTSTIDDLIGFQNEYILDGNPNTTFKYEERIQREDGYRTKVRIAEVPSYSCLEVTGFLQAQNTGQAKGDAGKPCGFGSTLSQDQCGHLNERG